MYEDSYIGQPQPCIGQESGRQAGAGALCPIYESSYMKICYPDTRLLLLLVVGQTLHLHYFEGQAF